MVLRTLIEVKCTDQELAVVVGPTLASGGKNEDYIVFDFCPLWDGFEKTATFYREGKPIKPYYSHIDTENLCVIPHEVLKGSGTLYFGVFGVLGDVVRTSEVLKYKIVSGAITEELIPTDPSPDLWEQILSSYKEVLDAVEESNEDQRKFIVQMENFIEESNKRIDEVKEMVGGGVDYDVVIGADNSITKTYVDGRREVTTVSSDGNTIITESYDGDMKTETKQTVIDSNGNISVRFIKVGE